MNSNENKQFARTCLLFGDEAMQKLFHAKVAIFGVGGVGGYVVEALARSGVGTLDLFDNDTVCISNLNRQIIATHGTIGQHKVDAAKKRILDINPNVIVNTHKVFYLPANAEEFDLAGYNYIVDAIDTVTAKIELVLRAQAVGVPIICSMGTGNKIHPELLEITDIYKTSVCPLARVMRLELKKRGVEKLKVVYSKEEPMQRRIQESVESTDLSRRQTPGSTAFVPAAAGLILAGEVVRVITGIE